MNTLSWLLYVAGVSPVLSVVLIIGGIAGIAVTVIGTMIRLSFWHEDAPKSWHPATTIQEWHVHNPKPAIPLGLGTAAAFTIVLGALLPSKQTVYLIAASEMGQRVAQTDDAKEIMDLLKAKVKDLLAEKKP